VAGIASRAHISDPRRNLHKYFKFMESLLVKPAVQNFKTLPISEEALSSSKLPEAERFELHWRFAAHLADPSSGAP
jgi:hypothetical protein